jgi:hypothetical protein
MLCLMSSLPTQIIGRIKGNLQEIIRLICSFQKTFKVSSVNLFQEAVTEGIIDIVESADDIICQFFMEHKDLLLPMGTRITSDKFGLNSDQALSSGLIRLLSDSIRCYPREMPLSFQIQHQNQRMDQV